MPLHDDEGRIIKWYGILFDIDELKTTESYLRSRERHANPGLKSWVQNRRGKRPTSGADSPILALPRSGKSISSIPFLLAPNVSIDKVRDWDAEDMIGSRAFGDRWIQEHRTAILRVPTVITGGLESNIVFNPGHSALALALADDASKVEYDRSAFLCTVTAHQRICNSARSWIDPTKSLVWHSYSPNSVG